MGMGLALKNILYNLGDLPPFPLTKAVMTWIENDLNERQPQKTTLTEDDLNGRKPQQEMTSTGDDLNGR